YRTYWLTPVIDYYVAKTNMDVQGTVLTGKEFFFQIAGPKSLEILEHAAKADFHDIGFARHEMKSIAGVPVRVLRLGMAGTLAYEVHGDMDKQEEVYQAIWEAGQAYGIKKLGRVAYCMNHTEAGFANINTHYPMPWFEDEDIAKFMWAHPEISWMNINRQLIGSMGDELELRFKTPYDVGWGDLVKYDHEFPGRAALEKIAAEDKNRIVTLEWNAQDVAAVYQTQFEGRDVEACESIDEFPNDVFYNAPKGFTFRADWVKADGKIVGSSYGRLNSIYYRRMISLGCIEKEYAEEGKELTLVWGTPGTRQMEIRVKVARCPYLTLENNKDIDVSSIPRYQG
ncbi:MAG: aminomethyl transferase family protein, partial [Lachnospiraceae bacterium]|nr:aminomethyl transferase family protein [Lachnospiraceae bacterium]